MGESIAAIPDLHCPMIPPNMILLPNIGRCSIHAISLTHIY
jgi:hypothetical protein